MVIKIKEWWPSHSGLDVLMIVRNGIAFGCLRSKINKYLSKFTSSQPRFVDYLDKYLFKEYCDRCYSIWFWKKRIKAFEKDFILDNWYWPPTIYVLIFDG